MIILVEGYSLDLLMYLFGFIFILFDRFSCLLFLRKKFTLVLQTFNWVFACKVRLLVCLFHRPRIISVSSNVVS